MKIILIAFFITFSASLKAQDVEIDVTEYEVLISVSPSHQDEVPLAHGGPPIVIRLSLELYSRAWLPIGGAIDRASSLSNVELFVLEYFEFMSSISDKNEFSVIVDAPTLERRLNEQDHVFETRKRIFSGFSEVQALGAIIYGDYKIAYVKIRDDTGLDAEIPSFIVMYSDPTNENKLTISDGPGLSGNDTVFQLFIGGAVYEALVQYFSNIGQ